MELIVVKQQNMKEENGFKKYQKNKISKKNEKKNVYMSDWVTLVYSRNYCSLINQLYLNKNFKHKKKKKEKERYLLSL